jgi:hypothetical protein
MQLKVGDILERVSPDPRGVLLKEDFIDTAEVLGVCGLIVFLSSGGKWGYYPLSSLELDGWQLKKTEGINMCHCFPLCKDCSKKKTRWVPEIGNHYIYLKDSGVAAMTEFKNSFEDKYRISIKNCFQTDEQAEAYHSELIERGK